MHLPINRVQHDDQVGSLWDDNCGRLCSELRVESSTVVELGLCSFLPCVMSCKCHVCWLCHELANIVFLNLYVTARLQEFTPWKSIGDPGHMADSMTKKTICQLLLIVLLIQHNVGTGFLFTPPNGSKYAFQLLCLKVLTIPLNWTLDMKCSFNVYTKNLQT